METDRTQPRGSSRQQKLSLATPADERDTSSESDDSDSTDNDSTSGRQLRPQPQVAPLQMPEAVPPVVSIRRRLEEQQQQYAGTQDRRRVQESLPSSPTSSPAVSPAATTDRSQRHRDNRYSSSSSSCSIPETKTRKGISVSRIPLCGDPIARLASLPYKRLPPARWSTAHTNAWVVANFRWHREEMLLEKLG